MVELQTRKDAAAALRRQGHNCASCVSGAYFPELIIPAAGLGGGVGGTGHICGAAAAMSLVAARAGFGSPADKTRLYGRIEAMVCRFADLNDGLTDCRDLRQPGRRPCSELIMQAVEILHEEGY